MLKENKIFEDLLENNKIDYDSLRKSSFCKLYNDDIKYDINMIVPVKGREHFLKPLHESFMNASKKSKLKICLTIVEISENDNQKKYCYINHINYVHINSKVFNKCLAMNFGALFTVETKAFLFHDLDCLLDNDFFNKLEQNINNKKSKALQCFPDRKLFYLDENLTSLIISGKLETDRLSPEMYGVTFDKDAKDLSPGGSIYVSRDIFFEIGGYDPEFFIEHSPEDSFFWEKVEMLGEKIGSCDNPRISIYHMNHERNENIESPHLYTSVVGPMIEIYKKFHFSEVDYKLDIILNKKNIIRDFYKGIISNRIESLIIDRHFKMIDDRFSPTLEETRNKTFNDRLNNDEVNGSLKIGKSILVNEIQPVNIRNRFCNCGELIDRVSYNFCQKCKRFY